MTGAASGARVRPTAAYPYSQGDLLAEKPVYNFSAFRGLPFLQAYADARRSWLAALPAGSLDPRPSDDGLAAFFERLCQRPDGASDRERFLKLLQRFEVTKRLWTDVDERLRPSPEASPGDTRLYALFALAALRLHQCEPHLSLLNAALKAHDIVTSQDATRLGADAAAVARAGVTLELETVAALAQRSGLPL